MILVDSCVYIHLLRTGQEIPSALKHFRKERDLVTCGVVRCEVLRGIKAPKLYRSLSSYLSCMLYAPTLNHTWELAEQLVWKMDRQGKTIPITDILIATAALQMNAAVLTFDHHFSFIPELTVIDRLED